MKTYPPVSVPEEIPARFAEGWNERDADKIAALFDENADFVNVTGIWWKNREDIRKAHDYGFKVIFSNSELRVGKIAIKYLSESVAVVHARMRLTGQTPVDNDSPGVRHTQFSFVLHQKDEGWSCASAHNTDIVPGKETNIINKDGIKPVTYRY
jgi:uncharacterized protein (TIGR02246 family)